MAEEQEIDLSHLDLDIPQPEQAEPQEIDLTVEEEPAVETPEPEAQQPEEIDQPEVQDQTLEQSVVNSSLEPAEAEPEVEEESFTGYDDSGVLSYLSEKLGRNIQSFDDVQGQREEVDPYADEDPEVTRFREFKQSTGRGLNDYMQLQSLDLSELSDTEVARKILEMKYPTLSKDELNFELSQYVTTEDDAYADESDKIRKSVALKKLIAEGLPQLEQLKQQFQTPVEQPQQQDTQAVEAEAQAFRQQSLDAAAELEGIRFKLNDDLNLDFRVHQTQREQLGDFMAMEHWRDSQGNVQHDRMMMDYAILQNIDTIVQEAFKQGVASGIAQEDRAERNITLSKDRPTFEGNEVRTPDIVVESPGSNRGFQGQLKVRKFGNQ